MRESFHLFMALVAALSGILFGYDTGVMSGAILFITKEFHLTAGINGIVMGAVLLGALVGAICSGRLTDALGRKRLLLVVAVIFMLGSLGTAVAQSILQLILGRIGVGIAIGVASYTAPLYISEISPQKQRGAMVALNQLAISVGILISYIVDYGAAHYEAWRWMLGLGFLPGLFLFLGMLYLPDSPRWMLSKGHEKEARRVLQKIRGPHAEIDAEINAIQATLHKETGHWRALFSRSVRPVLWIGFALAFIQQVTGINTILYYAPSILEMSGFGSSTTSILATMGIGAIFVLFTIISLPLIDWIGRRPLLMSGLVGMGLSLGVLAWLFKEEALAPSLHWLALVSMLVYIACFAFSLGPIMWLMIAEIYPLRIRGVGASLATCVNWASNLLVTATFLKLVQWIGADGTFSLYMIFSFLSLIFVYFLVPETKGISLEEIEANLFSGNRWRNLGKPL
jgi:sugar porter (SP) family MFS transporter